MVVRVVVVVFGFQGADSCQLFNAVLGELPYVARGQPSLIVGDFNVVPTKIPS